MEIMASRSMELDRYRRVENHEMTSFWLGKAYHRKKKKILIFLSPLSLSPFPPSFPLNMKMYRAKCHYLMSKRQISTGYLDIQFITMKRSHFICGRYFKGYLVHYCSFKMRKRWPRK